MLYDRWQEVLRRHADELALYDLVSDERWTFRQLGKLAEMQERSDEEVVLPRGSGIDFPLTVLKGWRDGKVVCPLEGEGQGAPAFKEALPRGCVHLKQTSATTGPASYVAFTAEQLFADVEQIMVTMDLRPDWPNLGVISLAHSYGFSNLITPMLCFGIPLILGGAPLPERVRKATTLFPALTVPGVPALWKLWHESDALARGVRLAISAGAPMPLSLEEQIYRSTGVKVHNFYGATECGGIAYDGSSLPRSDLAYAGEAMEGVELGIGAGGCLKVSSRAVGLRYWPENRQGLKDGVYETSDLARIEGSRVYWLGRASDQINVAGRKVLPERVEEVLLSHPGVRECAVFGVPGPELARGELVVAAIAADPMLSNEELREFVGARLREWEVPRRWWRLDRVRANERGKLSRRDLREDYLKGAKGASNA